MNTQLSVSKCMRRIVNVFLIMTVTACNAYPPLTPIEKPFGLTQGGESVEFDFRVEEVHGFRLSLHIYFLDKDEFNNNVRREKFIKQLKPRAYVDGSLDEINTPIFLRIRVKSLKVDGPVVDFDQTTDQIGFEFATKEYGEKEVLMEINKQKLLPGTYRIRVDNVKPVPEFAGRRVQIVIRKAWYGK